MNKQIKGLLKLPPYLPVDTSRPVNQVAEFSPLVFGLKEKEQSPHVSLKQLM